MYYRLGACWRELSGMYVSILLLTRLTYSKTLVGCDGVCIFPAYIFDAADHWSDLRSYSCKYIKYWCPIVLRVMSGSRYECVYDLTQRECSESVCIIRLIVFVVVSTNMCGICPDLVRHYYVHCLCARVSVSGVCSNLPTRTILRSSLTES